MTSDTNFRILFHRFRFEFFMVVGLSVVGAIIYVLGTISAVDPTYQNAFIDAWYADSFEGKPLPHNINPYFVGFPTNYNPFNLTTPDFYDYVRNYYTYSDIYDCKYWAFIYASYFRMNGIKYEYVITDAHVFVISKNHDNAEYCIHDGVYNDCYGVIS